MITERDFVIIGYNKERDTSAEYFAVQKILYRRPSLHIKGTLEPVMERIKMEFLSEFAFMEYLLSLLDENFQGMKWDVSKIELSGRDILLAGIYDESKQRTIIEKTIEIKTYTEKKVETKQIAGHKFETNKLEYPKANLYVQSFILKNNDTALAGFVKDIPSMKDLENRTDYSMPVGEMLKMSAFLDEFKK
jgi:hypothetical protein